MRGSLSAISDKRRTPPLIEYRNVTVSRGGRVALRDIDLIIERGDHVVIARALVHDPKALVLDEPTASLDLHAARDLRGVLRKVAAAGTTIVMVTHHLRDIIPEIGRVVLLKDGCIFADGPKQELLRQETLTGLFETPLDVLHRDGYYHIW